MNALTESKATNSFLGLTEEDRKCQNVEPLFNCTTRQYMDTLMQECGCIPFNIRLSDEVKKENKYIFLITLFPVSSLHCSQG